MPLTPEQYLGIERKAALKSEYYRGETIAMAGGNLAHNRIIRNAMRLLGNHLLDRPCELFSSDLRVCVTPAEFYTYPDIVVVCGEPQMLDNELDTLLNPTVVIEVFSDSTEAHDRGLKSRLYRSLESVAQYVLISSREVGENLFTRQPENIWKISAYDKLEETVELSSIQCRLTLADLYHKVY